MEIESLELRSMLAADALAPCITKLPDDVPAIVWTPSDPGVAPIADVYSADGNRDGAPFIAVDPYEEYARDPGTVFDPTAASSGPWWSFNVTQPVDRSADVIDSFAFGSADNTGNPGPIIDRPIPVEGGVFWWRDFVFDAQSAPCPDNSADLDSADLDSAEFVMATTGMAGMAFSAVADSAPAPTLVADASAPDSQAAATAPTAPVSGTESNAAAMFAAFATAYTQADGDGQGSLWFAAGPRRSGRR